MKKLISLFLIILALALGSIPAFAANTETTKAEVISPESTVQNIINLTNSKDWISYANLQVSENKNEFLDLYQFQNMKKNIQNLI